MGFREKVAVADGCHRDENAPKRVDKIGPILVAGRIRGFRFAVM